jgi:hypothetical protein
MTTPVRGRRAATGALEAAAAAAMAIGASIAIAGPFRVGPLRLGAPPRALAVGAIAVALRLALARRSGESRAELAASWLRVCCMAVLVLDATLVFTHLVATCGGLDSSGYLNEMVLLLRGQLTEYQPLARALPFPEASAAAAPLGFVPAIEPFTIAPRFPPGLPLVMAAFRLLGGAQAPFLVAPVLGCATAALAAAIVRRRHSAPVPLVAAVCVATNPILLFMSLQPMSDVPAAFWTVLAAFLLWRPSPMTVAGATAAGMALLTRPTLAPVVVALAIVTPWRARAQWVTFLSAAGIFVLLFVLWLVHLYGSPFRSGYGTPGQLFTLHTVLQNGTNYGRWLLVAHTPLAFLAFAAGWLKDRLLGTRAAVVFAATLAPYLVYASVFDDWEILRFLLPGLIFVFMVAAIGVVALIGSDGVRHQIALTVLVLGAAAGTVLFLHRRDAFNDWQREMKYRMVGEWFAANSPSNSVAIASLHSGSLRYYSGRGVLLVEALPAGRLAAIVSALRAAGYDPYVVLEQGDELSQYYARFHPDDVGAVGTDVVDRIRGVVVMHLTPR